MTQEQMTLQATLQGREGWEHRSHDTNCGVPYKLLHGHRHFVSNVVLSLDRQFTLSSSWDKTLRLWDLVEGKTTCRSVVHKKDVLSVAFSADSRLGINQEDTLKDWVSIRRTHLRIGYHSGGHTQGLGTMYLILTRCSNPIIVSCGSDKTVETNHTGHTQFLNYVTVSPNGSLCVSVGQDSHLTNGQAMLWDLNEGKHFYALDGDDRINAMCFSPNQYWMRSLKPDVTAAGARRKPPQCLSLVWSSHGQTLFTGYSDKLIGV
ncbi:unnamed protein product [Candidula unifasciata]|uniref:Small ribosomal subunit protein RACK1 n=1 Tax=Candidula unifasciata TaxID=100452 RepID=A0A8S3ZLN2_9EUPU|nr:unnamed protein product [Candidula unifasciata]